VPAPTNPLHLAVALDGAGWHPAAWREPRARPAELLTAGYWADVITEAERGLLDFATIDDSLSLQSARYGAPSRSTSPRSSRRRSPTSSSNSGRRPAPTS